jgi:PIN domain nuclease of toxin-antitoxin system
VSDVVLDASVVLAAVLGERGGAAVADLKGSAFVSTVNYAEVRTRLIDLGVKREAVDQSIALLGLEIVAFDIEQADCAADLRGATRGAGLSLGDRACLALASARNTVALTADHAWQAVEVPVQIELVR